jgi:hypothetical protein
LGAEGAAVKSPTLAFADANDKDGAPGDLDELKKQIPRPADPIFARSLKTGPQARGFSG